MKVSDKLREFQISMEGYETEAYRDSVGVLTIGIGHTSQEPFPFEEGDIWTDEQIEQAWRADIKDAEDQVNGYLKGLDVSQEWFDALVDLVFNTGKKPRTLLAYLASGNEDAAREQLLRWVYAGGVVLLGLVKRRLGTYIMTLGGDFNEVNRTNLSSSNLEGFNKLFSKYGYVIEPNGKSTKYDIVEI